MLVVMSIILIMAGLGIYAFKGGSATDGVKASSVVAAGEFDVARHEAIMRQTLSRVIIDTAWLSSRGDLAEHYLRRVTVAYLNPQGVDANGTPVASSGLSVDPANTANWVQAGAWERAAWQHVLRSQLLRPPWDRHEHQLRGPDGSFHGVCLLPVQCDRTDPVFPARHRHAHRLDGRHHKPRAVRGLRGLR